MNTVIIGIAGGSGSGKSTLSDSLAEKFPEKVTVIRHDDYYKLQVGKTYDERCLVNYDSPDAFDTDLLVRHLAGLKNGETVVQPVYDFTIHNRSDKTRIVEPSPVIILDGILILAIPSLVGLLDVKIFVDTDADVRILRRMRRDMNERARSFDSVATQYLGSVRPMHEKFVEPSKKNADIIIPNGGMNPVSNAMLEAFIKSL